MVMRMEWRRERRGKGSHGVKGKARLPRLRSIVHFSSGLLPVRCSAMGALLLQLVCLQALRIDVQQLLQHEHVGMQWTCCNCCT